MKKLISAVLLVACAGCDPAIAATYLLDLGWKDIEFTNSMALGESADIEIRNNGGAVSAGLMLYLTDRDKNVLALCTNMADGTLANSSIGTMNLATTNLAGKFDGASPRAEKTFDLSVWDAVENRLLASAPVVIRNNPLSEEIMSGWTNVPVEVTAELEASIAAAYSAATNAYALAYNLTTTNEPLWTAASNSVLYVGDVADVAYGTATNEAYRGDWGAAVSNAAVLRSIATVPVFDAYSAPASESLPFVVTNTGALTLSGLTSGSIGIRLTTTNASGIALYAVAVKDGVGETIASINPACDGTEQSIRWPWNASETLTVEATGIPSPAEGAESAIISAAQVETCADVSLVGKTNDLADQHLYVDYPAATNEAANRAYADDAADAALALALGEIGTATFNRDLAGYVQRWNPRFDTVAASNSLTTLYGGSTALRLDGNAAQIVPEIKAFSVEAGTVATLTVWSYAGGATNLVPEVTTNLMTGPWEAKPESIVSATNVDQYTAQVVFTNDAERTLFVRLIDTSGGDSVPVFRIFGGIAFGDGDAITNWPRGDVLGATINPPHTVATNDGLLAFTIGATGSGFPLTNDVSAAGFDIKSIDAIVGNSLMLTNDASVRDLTVRRNVQVLGNAEYAGDFTVSGNLTLIGSATNLNWITVDNRTNVYGGTNYYETDVYRTQVVYQTTIVYTNIVTTNNVTTYVTQNGQWNATNAEYAWFPHLRDYRDENAEAIGTWDFSGANLVGLPTQGITNIGDGLTGDGLETPLAVDWTDATTNAMTGISWESLGGLTQETDPIAIKPVQIGVGLLWTGTNLVATGEGTAIVTNEVDPRRYDAYREYATIDASTGTGTITSASALWLSLPASDEPRTVAVGAGFDAAQAWRFHVQIARGTNSLSIDTNLTGYAFLSLPVSSTNHVLIDRFPGDSNFRVIQVYR